MKNYTVTIRDSSGVLHFFDVYTRGFKRAANEGLKVFRHIREVCNDDPAGKVVRVSEI